MPHCSSCLKKLDPQKDVIHSIGQDMFCGACYNSNRAIDSLCCDEWLNIPESDMYKYR